MVCLGLGGRQYLKIRLHIMSGSGGRQYLILQPLGYNCEEWEWVACVWVWGKTVSHITAIRLQL